MAQGGSGVFLKKKFLVSKEFEIKSGTGPIYKNGSVPIILNVNPKNV